MWTKQKIELGQYWIYDFSDSTENGCIWEVVEVFELDSNYVITGRLRKLGPKTSEKHSIILGSETEINLGRSGYEMRWNLIPKIEYKKVNSRFEDLD